MKGRKGKKQSGKQERFSDGSDADVDANDFFTDEISEFTDSRNKISLSDAESESDEQEELFGLVDEDDESDEELGEWSKRLKQIKFQTKLDKKKSLPDVAEKSWGTKRSAFYGSGVKRKPKEAESDNEDEWLMEEKEIEKLQKKLDEDLDEDDFLIPSLTKSSSSITKPQETTDLKVKRKLSDKEKEELKKKLHPEAEPLRKELDNCLLELERLKGMKGWKAESRDTCFRLLAANIAFYLHMVETDEDCRGHPVLKRIVQWKKLAKMYEAVPVDNMGASDDEDHEKDSEEEDGTPLSKKARVAMEDSEGEESVDKEKEGSEEDAMDNSEEGVAENRPITYEIEKNKQKKKTAPNNPRVKHREKFRKAKIRRRGKIREYRPEVDKYRGEASGIRAGITRSIRLK